MNDPLLYIIVLNNHRLNDTLVCLESLAQSNYKNSNVILLDFGSPRLSIESIQSAYPDIQVIPLIENLGYAGNNNIGIESALNQGAEWVFILNDDTVVDSSCISLLIELGKSDPTIGILGPMVYHYDEPDIIQSAGGILGKYWQNIHLGLNEPDHGQFEKARQVEWISGCAIMVRGAMIKQIGMLDAKYFLYWEETEWCIRAGRAGWKILQVPNAKLWHKGVQQNYQPQPYVTYYMTRNYLYTLAKLKAPFFIRTIAYASILRTLLSWSVKPRWRNKRDHRNAMWRGMVDFFYRRMGPMPS